MDDITTIFSTVMLHSEACTDNGSECRIYTSNGAYPSAVAIEVSDRQRTVITLTDGCITHIHPVKEV